MGKAGLLTSVHAFFLLGHPLDISQLSASFKIGFGLGIEAEVGEPAFAGGSRNLFFSLPAGAWVRSKCPQNRHHFSSG